VRQSRSKNTVGKRGRSETGFGVILGALWGSISGNFGIISASFLKCFLEVPKRRKNTLKKTCLSKGTGSAIILKNVYTIEKPICHQLRCQRDPKNN